MNRKCLILILLFFPLKPLFSQETNYGPGYQTLIVSNPAFAGSNIDGIFRLSYFNFYPGNHYDLHSFFLSYDSYFSSLHGGVGFYISNDYLGGIINELRSGLSYSYFLQAGKDLYIYAGLSASFFHRGLNFKSAVFPDQIDAMGVISMPTSDLTTNESTTVFDVGTGLMFIYKKLIGGFAVTHLAQPDLNRNRSSIDRLNRKYMGHFLADIELNTPNYLRIMPLASFELQGRFFTACAGAVFESSYLSFSSMLLVNNNKNIDIQTGFSLRRDKIALFYNYRFNLKSGSSLMPFSLVHQVGLTFTSNNVEKRNKVRTINVPEM
jgi:type IX secretion system PorP/SprF family membrane protein